MSHKRAKKIRRLMNEDDTNPKEFAQVYRRAKKLSTHLSEPKNHKQIRNTKRIQAVLGLNAYAS